MNSLLLQYNHSEVGNSTDTFFVINNPIGITGNFINTTMGALIQCQTSQIYNLKYYQNYLTIMAIGVLVASFFGIMVASISADSSINYLWERLRKKTQCAYVELSQNIINRINEYHEYCDALPMKLDSSQCKKSKPLKYKHSLRFFMNFFPFFMITGGLYCVLILVEFENIHVLLEKEPKLISTIYQARFCIPKIYFLTTESNVADQSYSLANLYNGFTPVPDLKGIDIALINSLHDIKMIFSEPVISQLLSPEDYNKLFRAYPNSSLDLDMGVIAAIFSFRIESLFILESNVSLSVADAATYHTLTSGVAEALKSLSASIYSFSSNYVQQLLTVFLIYVSTFCIGHIIFCLQYYGPLLSREERVLKTLKKLMEYIPTTTNMKNLKASRAYVASEENSLQVPLD